MSTLNTPAHEIIIVSACGKNGPDLLQQCYDVRIAVFHREQGFPLETEIDEMDGIAAHFLLRLLPSHEPVGTIRVYKSEGADYYKLSRLAVLRDYRQHHFGRELVLALHDWVVQDANRAGQQNATVVSHSQLPVTSFYAKYGYQPEGDEFDEEGAQHQRMVARLPL